MVLLSFALCLTVIVAVVVEGRLLTFPCSSGVFHKFVVFPIHFGFHRFVSDVVVAVLVAHSLAVKMKTYLRAMHL